MGLASALLRFPRTEYYKNIEKACPETANSLLNLTPGWSEQTLVASHRRIPASAPVDSLRKLREVDVPTLVFGNGNDPIHRIEFAEALAQALPKAQFYKVPPKIEDVDRHVRRFQELVASFLSGIG